MENDYIVTTPNVNDTQGLDSITWADLHAANFAFNKSFCLLLSDNQHFISERVVRIIPRKRIVAFGTWQGKPVAIKLFFDPQNAKRHLEKDIAGIKSLKNNKIPTPELLYEGRSFDERVEVLIFERILDSRNMEEVWRERINVEEVLPALKSVIIEIATQHVLGLLQHDLHLKNFLLTEKTIYTLDGAQIEVFPKLLSKPISMNNLALLLSQLGIDVEEYQEILFKHYAEARGWTLKKEDCEEIFAQIKHHNQVRWKNYEKKIYRNSTDFSCVHTWQTYGMYNRHYEAPELMKFLSNPESAFQNSHRKVLKKGRSATVIRVRLDNRDYVVKRYNMKNIWHWLRRCLRQTRASSSWRFAQKLCLFGIPTANPVAYIEQNILGLHGKSYYVTQYVSGEHAGDYFTFYAGKSGKISSMIKMISHLLKNVAKVDMTHGDLKITNVLINAAERPVLIDLDGASEHISLIGLRKAWEQELLRFLKNFNSNPSVRDKFAEELEKW